MILAEGGIYHCKSPFFLWNDPRWVQVQLSSCLLIANVCPKFSKFFPNLTLPSLSTYPQDKNMTNQIEVILSNYPVPCMVKWPIAHLCVEGKTKTTNGLISCRKKIKFCIRAGCTAASSAFGQVHVIGSYFRT